MQSESQSMKTIAIMTLLFMPLSTVATVFGTQFMKLQEDGPFHITVSQDFWLLWVIAVPLTIIVMAFWRVSPDHSIVTLTGLISPISRYGMLMRKGVLWTRSLEIRNGTWDGRLCSKQCGDATKRNI